MDNGKPETSRWEAKHTKNTIQLGIWTIAWVVSLAVAGAAFVAEACQVPVFRFALERWEADPYTLTIIPGASGELLDKENAVVDFLQSTESEAMMAGKTASPWAMQMGMEVGVSARRRRATR